MLHPMPALLQPQSAYRWPPPSASHFRASAPSVDVADGGGDIADLLETLKRDPNAAVSRGRREDRLLSKRYSAYACRYKFCR